MYITEVRKQKHIDEFHKLPFKIYKNDKNWIPHIKQDIEKKFHKKTNKHFNGFNAKRWILKSESGELLGRIAAFVHPKTAYSGEFKVGSIGFFECTNNQDAANMLFNFSKKWLKSQETEAMDGPVNFGERDQFWGLLIKNFTAPTTYGMNYNPSYYLQLFENYGFKEYFKQFMYHRMIDDPIHKKFAKKAEILLQDKKFECKTAKNINKKNISKDFVTVYNDAWGQTRENFTKMKISAAERIFKALKPVMDSNIIFFAYYDNHPIGFFINIPEMNQIFKHINGNLNLLGKLIFLYRKKFKPPTTAYGLVFGVSADFHGKGVEGALIRYATKIGKSKTKYKDTVITWIGDFNPKMLNVLKNLGAKQYRTLATMRFLFDSERVFHRASEVNTDK